MTVLFFSFLAFVHFFFLSQATEATGENSDDESCEGSSGGICFDNYVSLSAEQIQENQRNRLGDEYIRPARPLYPYVPPTEEPTDDYIISTEEDYLFLEPRDKLPLVASNQVQLLDLNEDSAVQRAQRLKLLLCVTLLCILFGIIVPTITYYVQQKI